MDFELPEATRAIKSLVRRLVDEYAMPMEQKLLRGQPVTVEERAAATRAAKDVGLWGLSTPKEYGGAELSTLDNVVVTEENNRCLVPIQFAGNAGFLLAGTDEQKERYLWPALRGEKRYAFAQTEPSGGSDPGGMMQTTAVRDGDNWVINGTKMFISFAEEADFIITMCVTDREKRQHGGISAIIVDKGTPGMKLVRPIPVMRASHVDGFVGPWEIVYEDCVVPVSNTLGGDGQGFRLAQRGLSTARMNIGAQCVGIADRCLEMMVAYAKQRVLFGEPLARKQAIQGMLVDSMVDLHAARLMTYHAAWKNDRGEDTRVEAGMIKLLGSEMVGRVVDRAIQVHGAYGVTTELPFAHWYNRVRMMRIYEGASEVQKYQVLARSILH